ncbi:5-formyltetrahydrofolate cyclo-ligase [Actinoplanes oblitus]|uniref:5-formyltetrahydrofolate cyclo-ligase n=1 Tax=Actinoplanes oblitus TaxID=3040509 RepID=A0ABY8WFW4_9ACTN|nr:5-formyltetrahydrofolate cyclo-ligase [Actinoplanes oblitus]WIM96001.1 5-formyltetrahydrofolate cyclo-ligase [Actinoplanes oblitus]
MSDLAAGAEKSPQNKITLRAQLLTARRSLTATDRAAAATQLQDQTLAFVRRSAPKTLAAYVPSPSEPGGPALPGLLRAALPTGGRLLLPVLLPDNDLDWAEYTGSLTPATRGLHEPPGPRLGVTAHRAADLILVPALAVGRDGARLGKGGGSYDRALSRLPHPGPLVVALLHEHEALDHVPADPHDRPVDGALTPSGFSPRPI